MRKVIKKSKTWKKFCDVAEVFVCTLLSKGTQSIFSFYSFLYGPISVEMQQKSWDAANTQLTIKTNFEACYRSLT